MSELWGGGRDQRLFDQHVRAATRILKETLNQTTIGPGALGCTIKDVTDSDGTVAPRLTFLLIDAGRLSDWPEAPLPDVDFSLTVNPERGLILQWQSRLELERDLNDIHETVLSPFVTSIAYDYFDADLKNGNAKKSLLEILPALITFNLHVCIYVMHVEILKQRPSLIYRFAVEGQLVHEITKKERFGNCGSVGFNHAGLAAACSIYGGQFAGSSLCRCTKLTVKDYALRPCQKWN
jgi:hypothetical protein